MAATLLVYSMSEPHPDDLLRTVLIVFFVAIALHRFDWKPSGISDTIARETASLSQR